MHAIEEKDRQQVMSVVDGFPCMKQWAHLSNTIADEARAAAWQAAKSNAIEPPI